MDLHLQDKNLVLKNQKCLLFNCLLLLLINKIIIYFVPTPKLTTYRQYLLFKQTIIGYKVPMNCMTVFRIYILYYT